MEPTKCWFYPDRVIEVNSRMHGDLCLSISSNFEKVVRSNVEFDSWMVLAEFLPVSIVEFNGVKPVDGFKTWSSSIVNNHYDATQKQIKALAFALNDRWLESIAFGTEDMALEDVLEETLRMHHYDGPKENQKSFYGFASFIGKSSDPNCMMLSDKSGRLFLVSIKRIKRLDVITTCKQQ